jgi:hypothetical protein
LPASRLSMRKIKEVMRLRFELHLGYQQIGRSCAISGSTVHKYLKRAEAAGLSWPLPEGWDERRVEAAVFPRSQAPVHEQPAARTPPGFAAIHQQLRTHEFARLNWPTSIVCIGPPGQARMTRFGARRVPYGASWYKRNKARAPGRDRQGTQGHPRADPCQIPARML